MADALKTIDLTPTTAEYATMARYFAKAVVDDARVERRHDTGHLLATMAELVAYLATVMPTEEIKELLATIRREAERPKALAARDSD